MDRNSTVYIYHHIIFCEIYLDKKGDTNVSGDNMLDIYTRDGLNVWVVGHDILPTLRRLTTEPHEKSYPDIVAYM